MKNILLKFNTLFILLILLVSVGSIWGQNLTISTATSGTTYNSGSYTCGTGTLSGSITADNQDMWICICPPTGSYAQVTFSSINLADINAGGTANDDYLFVYQGCGTGGTVLYNPTPSTGISNITVTATLPNTCITIRLQERGTYAAGTWNVLGTVQCVPEPSNNEPCGALPISVFSTCQNTQVNNNLASQTVGPPNPIGCGIAQPNWRDVWYKVTVPPDGNITLQFTAGTLADAVAAVYSSSNGTCSGTFSQIACDDDSGPGLMPSISLSGQTPGTTLWIRFWDFNGDNQGTFDVCAIGNVGTCTPTTNDCAGTMPLCSDAPVSNLASGQGCVADLNASNDGCLAGEHNTSWFLVQISSGGTWGWNGVFDVSSNGIEYDWALWQVSDNPLSNPGICSSLSTPIRCSYASQTGKSEVGMGMNAAELPETSENASPSGNGYVGWLTNALPGEYYLLMIDRWSTTGGSFTIDFTGTASMNCAITALPIELLSFKGEKQGIENILYWSTASEINNDFFTIERSNNMQEWEVVGTVDGSGTSQEKLDYSLVDRKPFSDVTYYRLRQTDFDGKNKLSYTISIVNTIESDGLFTDLFPNPTNGNFYFNYSGINSTIPIEVEIYNNLGKLINTLTIEEYSKYQSISVNTENLANGVYQILLKQGSYTELRRIAIIR